MTSQFQNEFVSLNEVHNPKNISDLDAHGSSNPIDMDDIDVPEAEEELDILDARAKRKGKRWAKCWNYFKLIPMSCIVDGIAESKIVYK